MRIAHICTKFSRTSETFIYDLITGLELAGTENHVLATARVNATERPFPRVRILPLTLLQQTVFAVRKHGLGVYRYPFPTQATIRALRDIQPDVILAHFGGTGAAIAPMAHELGIPLVVVFHAFDLFMRHFQPSTYSALWNTGAHAVAISGHGKKRVIELGCPANRVTVIHCGVDITRFTQMKRDRPDTPEFRLVSIGRLVEKKGFDDLLRAVALLRERRAPTVRADIWGEGPLKRRLKSQAQALGIGNAVVFKGIVSSRDVPRLMRDYDAFVLPSRTASNGDTEGIPITLLEAQAAGLPVVATTHAGIPEAVPPPNREWLAGEGDIVDLTDKLQSLASRPPEEWTAIGCRGRQWVRRHFSFNYEVRATLRLFDHLTHSQQTALTERA